MPIGITEDHHELATMVRKWAEGLQPREAAKAAEGAPESLAGWSERYAELGLPTIGVPEEQGGGGGTLLDQAVALEAAAYCLVPGPLLSNTVAALTNPDLVAGISEGTTRAGLALGTVVLDGPTATVVPGADEELLPGTTPDLTRGVSRLPTPVEMTAEQRRLVVTLAAAEASGIARWCLDTAVEYAGVREQFGQKIGAFQSIKHLCAEMLERSEAATAAAWDAAASASGEEQQWAFAALVAEAVCFDAALANAKACIQVLGGIGFTFEHDAHLYLRRAIAMKNLIGPDAARLAALAADGVRRVNRIDFQGRDEQFREDARQRVDVVRTATDERAALVEQKLLAPHWPAPYGLGADPVQQLVIDEELAAASIARPDLKIGGWAAPTILSHGNDEQRERFLTQTLSGEVTWCQLFSEPGAGSDLAGLRTKAVRDGDGWRLTGQKVWTSLAHEADWAICLARTTPLEEGGKPHAGITYFLIDMSSEGLDIRPLREMTGESLFNEVFLDNVFVPDDCVVGEVDGGWKLAVTTLANERVAMGGTRLDDSVERAVELYSTSSEAQRGEIGHAVALATVVKLLGVRATLKAIAGQGPGAESSIGKLLGVRSRQDASELVVRLLGERLFTPDDEFVAAALHQQLLTRCLSIAGGTTQVLRNIVGERILRLPR